LDAIRDSQGIALSVSDPEMIAAARAVGAAEGLFVAPEGAACYVALTKLRQSGWVQAHESAVIFNTGAGNKYLECYADLVTCTPHKS
jgi:threonine synthase